MESKQKFYLFSKKLLDFSSLVSLSKIIPAKQYVPRMNLEYDYSYLTCHDEFHRLTYVSIYA